MSALGIAALALGAFLAGGCAVLVLILTSLASVDRDVTRDSWRSK